MLIYGGAMSRERRRIGITLMLCNYWWLIVDWSPEDMISIKSPDSHLGELT